MVGFWVLDCIHAIHTNSAMPANHIVWNAVSSNKYNLDFFCRKLHNIKNLVKWITCMVHALPRYIIYTIYIYLNIHFQCAMYVRTRTYKHKIRHKCIVHRHNREFIYYVVYRYRHKHTCCKYKMNLLSSIKQPQSFIALPLPHCVHRQFQIHKLKLISFKLKLYSTNSRRTYVWIFWLIPKKLKDIYHLTQWMIMQLE